MHFVKKIAKTILLASVSCLSMSALAQDKLADIAPVDVKMRTIDSLELSRLVNEDLLWDLENPAGDLYQTWDNKSLRTASLQLPLEHRIDLRSFCMPTESRKVTSHYGYRRKFRRYHYGTDIKVYVGDTIRAAFSGKVRIVAYDRQGYGYYVMLRHPNGLETLYAHLSKQLVNANQIVQAGEPIGLGGNTGRSFGSHLHFETRFMGRFINPEKLFSFEKQDVLGDYYVYRSSGRNSLLASHDMVGGEGELSEKDADILAHEDHGQTIKKSPQPKTRSRIHRVRSGESLYVIAKRYGTTVDKLCRLNNLSKKSTLRVGQIIRCS